MGVAAIASVLLNLALIPLLGIYGAAISTAIGYLLLVVASGVVSQRHYPVPWQLGRAAAILAIGAGLAAASLLGPDHVAWRLACVAAYPVLLLGLRIVNVGGGRALLRVLRRR
jgi:O-antigen/teichoic acid export membrane protein